MEENRKKYVYIIIFIACLASAAAIAYWSKPQSKGIESLKSGVMIWVKCVKCGTGTWYNSETGTECGSQIAPSKRDNMKMPCVTLLWYCPVRRPILTMARSLILQGVRPKWYIAQFGAIVQWLLSKQGGV